PVAGDRDAEMVGYGLVPAEARREPKGRRDIDPKLPFCGVGAGLGFQRAGDVHGSFSVDDALGVFTTIRAVLQSGRIMRNRSPIGQYYAILEATMTSVPAFEAKAGGTQAMTARLLFNLIAILIGISLGSTLPGPVDADAQTLDELSFGKKLKLAKVGDEDAQIAVARAYEVGKQVKRSKLEAAKW